MSNTEQISAAAHDSYLLRVWPGAAPWRATLTRVGDGASRTFTDPTALVVFLTDPSPSGWKEGSAEELVDA